MYNNSLDLFSEAVARRYSVKKGRPATLLKKRLQDRFFPVNFATLLRTLLPVATSVFHDVYILPHWHYAV